MSSPIRATQGEGTAIPVQPREERVKIAEKELLDEPSCGIEAGEYDVILIGGGLSALTCGFILARDRKRVLIIERNPIVGGVCSSFERDGFVFDRGPQVFPAFAGGAQLDNFLKEFGLRKKLTMLRPNYPFKVCLPSGELEIPANLSTLKSMLKARYPDEKGIDGFFNTLAKLKREMYTIESKRMTLVRFLIFWARHPNVVRYHKKTFSSLLERYIEDEGLKAYLAAPWVYTGLPPSKVSALTLSLMLAHMYEGGVYYPKGGSSRLPEVLSYGYKRYGGKLLLGAEVDSILVEFVHDVPVVRGVKLGEKVFRAKYVVSAIDARRTFKLTGGMVHKRYLENLERLQPALSAVRLMLGIKGGKLNTRAHETLLFEYDSPEEVYSRLLKGEPAFCGITVPSLTDRTLAPKGHEVVAVRTLVPSHYWNGADERMRERLVSSLIERAEEVVPDIERRILVHEIQTPETIATLAGSNDGALFGWAPTPEVVQKKRPTQQTPIRGLLLAGQWTQPGGGVVHAMESGWIAAFTIMRLEWMYESEVPQETTQE